MKCNLLSVFVMMALVSPALAQEQPGAEEPKAEEPKAEEPKAEEPKAEEPKAVEPKAEEPKAEEPKTEEPKTEEPKAVEPKAENREPTTESQEPTTEQVAPPAPPAFESTTSSAPAEAALPSEAGVAAELEAPVSESDLKWNLEGLYRISTTSVGDLRVDADGRRFEQGFIARHRLRFMPEASWGGLTLKSDLQLAASNIAADEPNERFAPFGATRTQTDAFSGEALKLRKLYLDWKTPYGIVRLGRMTSQWGTGILASSGDEDRPDWSEPRMGRDDNFGDIVNRVLLATAPLALVTDAAWARKVNVAIGADWIERDERVVRSEGDDGYQGIGVIRWADDDHEAGVYVAYRDLDDRNGETLNVFAYDAFAKTKFRRGDFEHYGVGEIALVNGTTTLARNNAFTGEQDVQQLGYVVRLGTKYLPWQLGGDVEVGYASGDSNPSDGFVRNFTFDPDYNPSLILFDELRAAETTAAQASASDPERVGYPPDAARQLPSQGAVSNALYVRPTVRYAWRDFGSRLALTYARAEENVVDPFNSTVSGGLTRNYQGGDGTSRELGVEVDVGVDYTHRVEGFADVSVALQGGRLWPGAGFENAGGVRHPPINLMFVQLVLNWLPPPEEPRG